MRADDTRAAAVGEIGQKCRPIALACIVQTDTNEPKFDKNLAFEAAKRSEAAAKPDSRWQQFARWRLGWAYYHMGDKAKGIEYLPVCSTA